MGAAGYMSIVIVGHIDHGTSTLIGRLLYDSKSLSPEKMEEIRGASRELGRDFEFAFLVDQLREESQLLDFRDNRRECKGA